MTNLKPVDVAIIGGGWTGLLMAKEITSKTSQSVAVFERGIPRKIQDYAVTMDELDYNIRLRMMQNTAEETITHRHSLQATAVPVRQHGSFHPGTGVGGAGEHWGGASPLSSGCLHPAHAFDGKTRRGEVAGGLGGARLGPHLRRA